ncbi:MAG: hypothetical protein F9K43_19775 [Bauldia sp.]|nr:MAG: hypothetical protein F9K43_19775 [Bauldia sp.]
MPHDPALPDPAADPVAYERAVRQLRDHLLGAVDVDQRISLNGRGYLVAWADRRPATAVTPDFKLTAGMRVVERPGFAPAEVLPTGEEQITLVVDGERLVFHLVEARDRPDGPDRRPPRP